MAEPFLAEIRIVSFGFPPKGWAACNGQILPINQNQALFSLLGTQYGGNGQVNFALPNLRGRVPVHMSAAQTIGESGGAESVSLQSGQEPAHSHTVFGTANQATAISPAGNVLAQKARGGPNVFHPAADTALAGTSLAGSGAAAQAHSNVQPYLALQFVIALQGIFPSQL
jgi:microcystin-dependent protein